MKAFLLFVERNLREPSKLKRAQVDRNGSGSDIFDDDDGDEHGDGYDSDRDAEYRQEEDEDEDEDEDEETDRGYHEVYVSSQMNRARSCHQ